MTRPWRLLLMVAALNLTLGAAISSAQTVFVRNAPPDTKVEAVFASTTTGTGTVDAAGEAKVDLKLPDPGELDANVYLDVCDKLRRVIVIDRNKRPDPPGAGCERREISGIFLVRRINTLVVDLGGANPTLLLIKGNYTPPKPAPEGEEGAEHPMRPAPKGLALFAGANLGQFRDAFNNACGNAPNCSGHNGGLSYQFGITYWLTKFLGAEGSYLKPRNTTVKGGDTFNFDSSLDVDLYTIAGKLAIPAGPVRIYGTGGANYHQSTLSESETIELVTQSAQIKTHGWGLFYGGGIEGWVTRKFALYGDVSFSKVKGNAETGGEAKLDDRFRALSFGVKVLLSR